MLVKIKGAIDATEAEAKIVRAEYDAAKASKSAAKTAPVPSPIYRGGSDLTPRLGVDVRKGADGLIHPFRNGKAQGLSLNIDPKNKFVQQHGGAFPVDAIPDKLQLLPSGGPGHYVVAPKTPMTFEEYEALCKQIDLGRFNMITQ